MDLGMGIADLPRWLWIAMALFVGLTHGSVREWSSDADPLDRYHVLLTDQGQFEHALVAESHGHRHFKDVTVYPHWVRGPSGGKRLVHLVTGFYWDGRTSMEGGAVQAQWNPACYVAPVPYTSIRLPDGGSAKTGTVLDYLAGLRTNRGVEFRYAWWWWVRRPLFTSTLGAFVLIGAALPTAINLLAFGTLLRPPREKRPSLWRVRHQRPIMKPKVIVPGPAVASSPAEAAEIATAPSDPATPAPAPTIRPLAPADDRLLVPASAEQNKHFGAKPEDFYPTELRVAPPHDPKPAR